MQKIVTFPIQYLEEISDHFGIQTSFTDKNLNRFFFRRFHLRES